MSDDEGHGHSHGGAPCHGHGEPPSPAEILPNADGVYDVCGDGSVLKTITTEGVGEDRPDTGDKVRCHYIGTLMDGTQFDSSRDRGDMFEFTIGSGVIQGWSDGVASMKKGERAIFEIESHKAYGERGSPPKIPGGATLKFDIELASFTPPPPPPPNDVSVAKDGSVVLQRKVKGKGYSKPKTFAKVTVEYTIRAADNVADSGADATAAAMATAEFTVDVGDAPIRGIEEGVQSMVEGEVAELAIKADSAFSGAGNPSVEPPIQPNADVVATVKLVSFENEAEHYELEGVEEIIAEIAARKDHGNVFFKAKDYVRGAKRYETAINLKPVGGDDDEAATVTKTLVPSYLNLAACQLKLGQFTEAKETCDDALEIDAGSIKGLFRRGCAHSELGDWDTAIKDLKACLALDAANKGATKELKKVHAKIKAHAQKQKSMFGGMFDKMGAATAKKEAAAVALKAAALAEANAAKLADGYVDICGDGSVLKKITVEGEEGGATPATGDKVKCHYIGTLMDGTKFDSSRDRDSHFEFSIGSGVIQGWSDGVATMKKGERAIFEIESHKAYGDRGSPPKIPGGATLQFDIELDSFTSSA